MCLRDLVEAVGTLDKGDATKVRDVYIPHMVYSVHE